MPDRRCKQLVLATGNANKVREFHSLLAPLRLPILSLADFPTVIPVVEEGTTLAENSRLKASAYAKQLQEWVLSDDTGLEVDALSGAPGVRSARYAGEKASMKENREKLLTDLADVPEATRTARFVCHLAIADPQGTVVAEAVGTCEGRIRREAKGEFGFGYDSLFEVAGSDRTLAEFNAAETAVVGHRAQAARALFHFLMKTPSPAAGSAIFGVSAMPDVN